MTAEHQAKLTLDLVENRAAVVQDRLSFPSINDRFCEGSRAIFPWVNGYLNIRDSNTFESGALLGTNLCSDSNTVAAVYGQLAGAYYGETGINTDWIRTLSKYHIFYHYADQLLRFGVCDYRPR